MGNSYGAGESRLTDIGACCCAENSKIKIIASENSWIEGEAVRQLEETAKLPGIVRAVGHPDLHPGKGIPIGASFLSDGVIYPHLVGNDIGCGMGLWRTDMSIHRFKLDKVVKKLKGYECPYEGRVTDLLLAAGLTDESQMSLGTIGGGNHFTEFQKVEQVFNPIAMEKLGLDAKAVHLLVHSGSRGLGQAILRSHVDRYQASGLHVGSNPFVDYIQRHDRAVAWAEVNRQVIARRFLESLSASGERCLDICHNSVTPRDDGSWLHRKGAAPTDRGAVVIPGSRGAITYVAMPVVDGAATALWSLAHGAGRKWKRTDVKGKLSRRYRVSDLERTKLGGRVICEDKALIFEEAPEAYKDIEAVIFDLQNAGLIELVASMRPLITYKTRREPGGKR